MPLIAFFFCTLLQAQDNPRQLIEQLSQSSQQALAKKQFEKAESDLRHMGAIALDQLGAISNALNDAKLAEAAYQGALRLSAGASLRALLGLGIAYLKTGRYDEGIAAVQKILAIDLLSSEARHVLGKLYFMQGRFDLAAQELATAYQAQPANGRIGYTLALAHLKQKRLPEAQEVFRKIIEKLGDTPQLHVLLGRGLRETGYTDEATTEFRRALELDPACPRAHYYLGMAYLVKGDVEAFPEAVKEFETELAHHPNTSSAHLLLGIILLVNREYPTAIDHLRRAAELDPRNPDPHRFLGQALYQSGDQAGAIPVLRESIELTTDLSRNHYQIANAHFMLGQALRKVGQQAEAVNHLKRSQELKAIKAKEAVNPKYMGDEGQSDPALSGMGGEEVAQMVKPEESAVILDTEPPDAEARKALESAAAFYRSVAARGYYSLARLEVIRPNLKRAAEYMESAARWDDSLPDLYFNLGLTQVKLGQPAKAAISLVEALKRDPQKPETTQLLANLALALVDQRLGDEALRVVEALLRLKPNVADLYVLRGRVYAQHGKWDEALRELQAGLALNASVPDAHYYTGTVLIRQGEMDKAREQFEKELSLNPRHSRALYHKAFILVSQRKMEEAIPLLEEVIRLEPTYAEPYYQLGRAQTEGDQLIAGIANLETAAHLSPNAPYVFYQLSRAYMKAQRKDDAAKALERYRELKKAEQQARSTPPPLESQ